MGHANLSVCGRSTWPFTPPSTISIGLTLAPPLPHAACLRRKERAPFFKRALSVYRGLAAPAHPSSKPGTMLWPPGYSPRWRNSSAYLLLFGLLRCFLLHRALQLGFGFGSRLTGLPLYWHTHLL